MPRAENPSITRLALAGAFVVLLTACGADDEAPSPAPAPTGLPGPGAVDDLPAPAVRDGALDPATRRAIDGFSLTMLASFAAGEALPEAGFEDLAASGDARVAWIVADYLRFVAPGSPTGQLLSSVVEELTGARLAADNPWRAAVDQLLIWDLPAYPDYVDDKAALFEVVEPAWEPFFADPDAEIDWRLVSWGGVFIDDRPLGSTTACLRGCIPSLDDPAVTAAADGDWYPDDRVVFGVVVDGAARAYPRNQMEVHEMVNDELGGRRIAMPYCTLCGSAQAYFVDDLPADLEMPVLRTSGLLSRSNKVMYDLTTRSVFDTFTGVALSGPLREAGVTLTPVTVVTTTWADWRAEHPDTTILAEDGGLGRTYELDPLGGRDDNGPIFPIGDVDPRLGVQDRVLGVQSPNGNPVAFPVDAAQEALANGEPVELAGLRVVAAAGGLAAETDDGDVITSHEAFWFAWSQFMPDTLLWEPGSTQ